MQELAYEEDISNQCLYQENVFASCMIGYQFERYKTNTFTNHNNQIATISVSMTTTLHGDGQINREICKFDHNQYNNLSHNNGIF